MNETEEGTGDWERRFTRFTGAIVAIALLMMGTWRIAWLPVMIGLIAMPILRHMITASPAAPLKVFALRWLMGFSWGLILANGVAWIAAYEYKGDAESIMWIVTLGTLTFELLTVLWDMVIDHAIAHTNTEQDKEARQ